ncbi:hypothetical protein [Paraburkholderia sp. BCC1886]|uniref:hypothetical protein n=1 Tax=Paraburkholderia sp. BCC1886 TaxID=2562670 RepID=UPI0011844797|nr:hypothetical protein [Paraburkholderia sp. BCC1886]
MGLTHSNRSAKQEVSTLPTEPHVNRNELSNGLTADIPGLLQEDIKDRRRVRAFQTVAFYGACTLIFFVFCAMFHWVNLVGTHIWEVDVTTNYRASLFVVPTVVLATLGALLTLALLKFAFRSNDKKDDEPYPVSLMQALGSQALEVLNSYLSKKRD